jgi:hypothetical protein
MQPDIPPAAAGSQGDCIGGVGNGNNILLLERLDSGASLC